MRGDAYRTVTLNTGEVHYFGNSLAIAVAEGKAAATPDRRVVVWKLSPGKRKSITWVSP